MSEQTTDSAPGNGPVAPTKPDVSAFGRRTRGRRVAAAQRGHGNNTGTQASGSTEGPASTPNNVESSSPVNAEQHASSVTVAPAPERGPKDQDPTPVTTRTPATSPEQPGANTAEPAPAVPETAAPETTETEAPDSSAQPPALVGESAAADAGADGDDGPNPARAVAASADDDAPVPGTPEDKGITDPAASEEESAEVDDVWDESEPDHETLDEDSDNENYSVGKTTQQTYVPDAVATRFHRLRQTGRTAEIIVLTAVNNCEDRLPQLIKDARGPVQESGLFPGLPVIERGPGRKKAQRPNDARIQYQVSPQYLPTLTSVAKKHRLKLSVLVRLALGDYFGVPVRLGRRK